MKITKNKVVALEYVLKLEDGIVVDASGAEPPFLASVVSGAASHSST